MDNSFIQFGVMLGIWTLLNQIVDALTFKHGYVEFSAMWAGVVALLIVGFGIYTARMWRNR